MRNRENPPPVQPLLSTRRSTSRSRAFLGPIEPETPGHDVVPEDSLASRVERTIGGSARAFSANRAVCLGLSTRRASGAPESDRTPSRARLGTLGAPARRARGRARSGQGPRPRASVPRAPPRSRRASPSIASRIASIGSRCWREVAPVPPPPSPPRRGRPLGRHGRGVRGRARAPGGVRERRRAAAGLLRPPASTAVRALARGPAREQEDVHVRDVQSREDRARAQAPLPLARAVGGGPRRGGSPATPDGWGGAGPAGRRRSRRSRCRPVRGTRWTRRPSGPAPPSRFAAPTSTRSRS